MNRVQEMEERISNIEDKIEKSDTLLKQNVFFKKKKLQHKIFRESVSL